MAIIELLEFQQPPLFFLCFLLIMTLLQARFVYFPGIQGVPLPKARFIIAFFAKTLEFPAPASIQ
ncbi:MAG: hypothetical protein A2V57_08410 [Candidatus Aminicenantes bacterium RBG_19FT_COMBO_65_30]|nr:MAG: hypothetical protein A2V57_08410 [Candidatus Aminicenantes bacterium RBG_19FT_COMBO_65_30]